MNDIRDTDVATVGEALGFETSTRSPSPMKQGEIAIAPMMGFDNQGKPLAKCEELDWQSVKVATAAITLEPQSIGRQVTLMFNAGAVQQPIIIGMIRSQLIEMLDAHEGTEPQPLDDTRLPQVKGDPSEDVAAFSENDDASKAPMPAAVDAKKLPLASDSEICLRCGDASTTSTKAGEIIILGSYILNRSCGVNRIKGGSVDIN